jgi:hypothetical protein
MNLAFAIFFLWVGAACLYVASHGVEASNPWGVFRTVLDKFGTAEA